MKTVLAFALCMLVSSLAVSQVQLGDRCFMGFDDWRGPNISEVYATPGDTIDIPVHIRAEEDISGGYDRIRLVSQPLSISWCQPDTAPGTGTALVGILPGMFWKQATNTKSMVTFSVSTVCDTIPGYRLYTSSIVAYGVFKASLFCAYSTGNSPFSSQVFIARIAILPDFVSCVAGDGCIYVNFVPGLVVNVCPSQTDLGDALYPVQDGPEAVVIKVGDGLRKSSPGQSFGDIKALY